MFTPEIEPMIPSDAAIANQFLRVTVPLGDSAAMFESE